MSTLIDDLREQIAGGEAVIVVGAGVAIQASGGAEVASWPGLLRCAVQRCEELGSGLPSGWGDRQRAALDSGDLDELLSVAEQVSSKLGAPSGGEFTRWLRETVGGLAPARPEIVHALVGLGCPLATTNYDSLLETVSGQPPITWRNGAGVERVLRREEAGIVHLHGHWQSPDTVVLGIRSYEAVLADPHAQEMLRALRTLRTLVFVGFGAGLRDPNFGALLRWSRGVFSGSEYRHFRLVAEKDVTAARSQHKAEERVFCLSYGMHEGLPGFLRSLRPSSVPVASGSPEAPRGPAFPLTSALPASRPYSGRQAEVKRLSEALASGALPTRVLGPPGIGKSTVALAALHDSGVASRFGGRRLFVRCDGVFDAAALASAVLRSAGGQPAGDLLAALVAWLKQGPSAIVLDNFETPWDGDAAGVEQLLVEITAVDDIALAITMRGSDLPLGPHWSPDPLHVRPLPEAQAREMFLAIAPARADDPLLNRLLADLAGVPLAIELMAHVATDEADLARLKARWGTERTEMLRRHLDDPHRASIAASVSLSVACPRVTPAARQLLEALGTLADGLSARDLGALFPKEGLGASRVLRGVGLAFDEGDRLRMLAPIREHVARAHPPQPEDRQRVIEHYLGLVRALGPKAGAEGGAEAVARLAPEAGNVEALLLAGLEAQDPGPAIEAAIAWAECARFSGLGTARPVEAARRRATGDAQREARCCAALGDLALARSDHDAARARYEEALPLFRRVGDVLGEANCIKGLGNIALERSDHDAARARYEEALPLYRRIGEPYSIGVTHRALARVARSDDERDAHLRQAEAAWRSIGRLDLIETLR